MKRARADAPHAAVLTATFTIDVSNDTVTLLTLVAASTRLTLVAASTRCCEVVRLSE
jgi:hypothetical protein